MYLLTVLIMYQAITWAGRYLPKVITDCFRMAVSHCVERSTLSKAP